MPKSPSADRSVRISRWSDKADADDRSCSPIGSCAPARPLTPRPRRRTAPPVSRPRGSGACRSEARRFLFTRVALAMPSFRTIRLWRGKDCQRVDRFASRAVSPATAKIIATPDHGRLWFAECGATSRDQCGVGAAGSMRLSRRKASQRFCGIGMRRYRAFSRTCFSDTAPGMTEATTGWASTNCRAAAGRGTL